MMNDSFGAFVFRLAFFLFEKTYYINNEPPLFIYLSAMDIYIKFVFTIILYTGDKERR